ncbi:hypothetical protein B0I35DRAFT_411966 [Stachybotrys elegans]|uniref:C2H2-type domain-containing protein n=1 Tax=Stachybotrys elegans TaxID=80388 RepID=A0A8K0SK10_9HYPO|nr:hypothetical protein B0I35DRAFT_411966 [Stachybotrys elegans]
MAPTESWSDADASSTGPSAQQDQLNRQMIRHLMTQYSHEDILRMFQEESSAPSSQNDAASIFTSSTHSSVKSEDAVSIFDSGSSIRTFSDTSSTRGSILSNVSARTSKFLSRNRHSNAEPAASLPQSDSWDADDAATSVSGDTVSTSGAAKQKGAFMCGFCKEEGIQKTCTRKNDLKRHMEDFHNMNAQWFCRHRGCKMVFDWQTAYKTHLKTSHGGSRMSLEEGKVNLCPQTVFACGFSNCTQVFEASTDEDAPAVYKEYVGHIVKHFDEGTNSGEWTYSMRIRNLLRQSGVMRAWNNSAWSEADRNSLTWNPQTSGVLRKRLETRHIGDLQLLIQYAIMTGSDQASLASFRGDFITPVKEECQMMIPGHKIRPPSISPSLTSPVEAEAPEFRISRGNNPSLAAYLASQRRVYVPRAPVRSGRSARPPMRSAPSPVTPQAPQFGYAQPNNSHGYDPRHQQRQQYAMIAPTNGGIIAEDINNLRSMTGHAPDGDMDMADAQMVDASYMSHQQHNGFPNHYGSNGMQVPGQVDACGMPNQVGGMEQHGFVSYSSGHPY